MRPVSGFQIAPRDRKLEKWQWCHIFPAWRHRKIFWRGFISLVILSFLCKFRVNIITGSGAMTSYFYKELTRNPGIGNTAVWVLLNIWRLEQVKNTNFGMNVSNKMLLNATKCQGYSFYGFWVIKGKPTGGVAPTPPHPPSKVRIKFKFSVELNKNTFSFWK